MLHVLYKHGSSNKKTRRDRTVWRGGCCSLWEEGRIFVMFCKQEERGLAPPPSPLDPPSTSPLAKYIVKDGSLFLTLSIL